MRERPNKFSSDQAERIVSHTAQERRKLQRDRARSRNGRRHNQRRKGRRLIFRILLLVLLIGAIACGALTLLCKAETIEVVGGTRYDAALVLQTSGIQQGNSLLLMNADRISQKVSSALPYVQKIVLHRTLPSKVVVEIVEAVPKRAYVMQNGVALCDDQKRLLEILDFLPDGIPLVLGANLSAGADGGEAEWEKADQKSRMEDIDRLLEKCGLDGITRYDLRDEVGLKLYYQDAIQLDFGSQSNFEYKIRFAKEYLDNYYIEGKTGVLNLSMVSGDNRKAYFREQDLSEQLADTGFTPPEEPSDELSKESSDEVVPESEDSQTDSLSSEATGEESPVPSA